MQQEPAALRMADPGIRAQFTEAAQFQSWLDVEAALAQAQADLEVIPRLAADEITRKAQLSLLDLDAIHEGLAKTGHSLVPLIWELDRVCDGDSGGYVHWGATTQNITQTGKLLMLREAHHIFLSQMAQILTLLANLAEETKDYALPGRTHGQHAVPATFGYKVAVWIDELCRHVERLRGCEDRVFVAMLGGGAGTLASLGEVEEPVPPGTVGSSTMPQKRNPKLAQDIVAVAAQIRALVPLALEAMITEHEANRTTSVMMNRALDQSAVLTGDLLQYVIELFSGIRVFPERMRANLDLSGGLIMSEAIMLELGRKLGRQRAHDAVYDAAQASVVENRPFKDTLAEVEEVTSNMAPQEIETLLDPTEYTGICSLFAQREASRAREVAASLNS
jgi:3-carboxy-cis,cis-muconate cycloisomerase